MLSFDPVTALVQLQQIVTARSQATQAKSTTNDMIKLTPNLVIAARGLLKLTQEQLAEAAGLNRASIVRAESEDGPAPREETLVQIQATLERLGVEFLNSGQPGVRLVARDSP